MTMWKKLFSIAALALVCLGVPRQSVARDGSVAAPTAATVGVNFYDVWCVGKSSGSEVCIDGRGNFVPISNNEVMLGSDTNRFRVAHITSITVYGDQTDQGNLSVNGNTTLGNTSADTLDLNVTTVTINATINGVKFGTSTTDGTYILTIDGSSRIIGINDQTPDATLEVVPDDGDAYALRVSSQNGSTNILGVDATNQQAEVTGALGVNDTTPEASLTLSPLNASTTAQIISAATSQTADLFSVQNVSLSTMTRIGPNGHLGIRRYQKAAIDTLVPDFLGALIQCSDCTGPYTVCGGTGTAAAQWANTASSTTAPGANSVKSGCGTGE